ncbi:nicotinate (nicotinamide) nucleotide adenylyltransferase [Bordetella petrii]|uniref:nicotinate (nicotinamide) nucleotide adenylyltransferase n=1 Tax=Bordetella petrii TaxID=94624 RepID=UPI001E46787B|nr:nicotinate (nicotinamide) nucleotide adenylyltransferase [Bordetella petrii]MCD0502050.1 nicotinate (nicotinamide) nucleotide adenylyltransferase [Bordetella petrii]
MKRIGLLGGSFDPVHQAHLALACAARDGLRLDQVQFIPAANPWQRAPLQAAPEHRLRMIELAIDGQAGLAANPIELERSGPTYTIDTLRALPASHHYIWLLGADQLANFCTWHQWQAIAERVDLAVATRPGTPLSPPVELQAWLDAHGRALATLPFAPMDVSASDIRTRLAQGLPTQGLLPPAVSRYIANHGLYQ